MKTNDRIINMLTQSALTDNESVVYMHLLQNGGDFPSSVAKRTGIKRTTAYKILLDLSVKGLINEVERKKKLYYQVERPQKLLRYAESNARRAQEMLENTKAIIPDIEGLFTNLSHKPKITYAQGYNEVLSIYEDQISYNKPYELLAFANIDKILEILPNNFLEHYRKEKARIGITARGIVPDTFRSSTYVTGIYGDVPEKIRPTVKYIPATDFPYENETIIYGNNKVSIVNFVKDNITGILIEDEIIHKTMRMIFELAWKGADI